MAPKTKNHSKAKSRLLNADQSASPRTPDFESEATEEDLFRALEDASCKFPALIAKSAIIAKVVDVDVDPKPQSCMIWLSESSMIASSLAPLSIVSVIHAPPPRPP